MTVTKQMQEFFENELRDLVSKYVRRHRPRKSNHERLLDSMRNIPWKLMTLRVRNAKPHVVAHKKGRSKIARKD